MEFLPRLLRRAVAHRREVAVLTAGCLAGAALLWAGVTVHEGMSTAGELAVARLAGTAADTVVAEWERMLRAEEPPVAPSGEVFYWTTDAPVFGGLPEEAETPPLVMSTEPVEASVPATLLREAERQELVVGDPSAALGLTLEALEKGPEDWLLPQVLLRALQLAVRLGRDEVVRTSWERLRVLRIGDELVWLQEPVPARLLGWLVLPEDMKAAEPGASLFSSAELEALLPREDRLTLGPRGEPEARFELAPMLAVLLERLGVDAPPLERRKFEALRRVADPPTEDVVEQRWIPLELAGRAFFARRDGERLTGFFYAPRELERALSGRSGLPEGFAVDLAGDDETLGSVVRPRTELPGSTHAFTLRHADPERIARAESMRMRLLRGAFIVLAILFVMRGWRSARLVTRERRLAQLKNDFIAGVSHDLRTPVASILLLAENLESGAAERSGRERYHAALRREATRLRRLVDDVLDFSRLERGETPRLEREPVDLARFADELEQDCRARVEEAGRRFESVREALPAAATLDATAVRRALENLVDNALKHGRGTVRLDWAGRDGRLCCAVSDEGPGVPAGDRERVFEPFERLQAANGHVGGTGLGLAIVRAIARAHGGEARVRAAEAGAGAVFELDLPLEPTEGEEA